MCKRLLLSALAVAFSAGAILGVTGAAGADSGISVQADWSWSDSAPADSAPADWSWDTTPADWSWDSAPADSAPADWSWDTTPADWSWDSAPADLAGVDAEAGVAA